MAQIATKFIQNDAVNDLKLRLRNNQYLRGRNAADNADVDMLKVNASDRLEFASVPQVTADAASANDLVRLSQFQAFLEGVKPKQGVATVALADVDLASGADQSSQGGYSIQDGDRVLLANQTADEENGIYVAVTAIDAQTWVRADDYNAASEIPGSSIPVRFGTHQGYLYVNTVFPATLDTDPINFAFRAGAVQANHEEETLVLDATDITNQYIDLAEAAVSAASISLFALNGPIQRQGVDYTVSLTGGAGGVTRLTFAGGLATGGASELVDTDVLVARYSYL